MKTGTVRIAATPTDPDVAAASPVGIKGGSIAEQKKRRGETKMDKKTGLILLAADFSQAQAKAQQLPPTEEEHALDLCIRRILAAGITDLVVVTDADQDPMTPMPHDLPVTTILRSEESGRKTGGFRAGIAALPADVTGIITVQARHAFVLSPTYALLENVHRYRPDRILIPTYRNRDGHPILFPTSLCRADTTLETPETIIAAHPDRVVRLGVEDPSVAMNTDYADKLRVLVA
jgi:CTP:molybdopterin cytidylyltransferase MocA